MTIRSIVLIMITILLKSCSPADGSAGDSRMAAEDQAFLHTLGKNMRATITDITERQRKPTNQWLLNTYYPLSEQELEALKSVENQDGSFGSVSADNVIISVESINVLDETGAQVELGDTTQNPLYLQRFGLWDHDQQLSQNLGVTILARSTFAALKGSIQIKLMMQSGATELVHVPVDINIDNML